MRNKTKAFMTAILTFSIFSLLLVSMAAAAGSITVTPTGQGPGSSVSIAGTGFGATKAVGIGFGAEGSANDTNIPYSATPDGKTSSGRTSNYPIKPGSFVLTSLIVATGEVVPHTDNGDGTLSSPSIVFASGTINYATGQWSTIATMDISSFERVYGATYTRYQYNLTSAAGITTNATGAFTTSITIPSAMTNGNYNVTAIDTSGNRAVAPLTVSNTIPEILSVAAIMMMPVVAVGVGSWYFRKRQTIKADVG